MRILQVYPYFTAPPSGGVEAVIYNLAIELTERGHRVTILSGNMNHFANEMDYLDGIELVRIPTLKLTNYAEVPLGGFHGTVAMNDIVHVHCLGHSFTNRIARLSIELGKVTVVSALSLKHMVSHLPFWAKPFGKALIHQADQIAKRASAIQTKNVEDYNDLARIVDRARVHLIPDGIGELYFKRSDREGSFRQKHGLVGRKIVLYVGRMHKLKGIEVLARSMAEVKRQLNDVVLIYVGAGPHMGAVKSLCCDLGLELGEDVFFTGFLPEEKKIEVYDAADVVIIPSVEEFVEAFSIVLSEAWSRGKPVIASAVGALKTRIKNGANGLLVRPNEYEELAHAIILLLTDKATRKTLVEGKKEIPTWKQVAETLEGLYMGRAKEAPSSWS